jgi:hypothetical protein
MYDDDDDDEIRVCVCLYWNVIGIEERNKD